MKIKRILFYVISVLVCFLLQTSVFNFLKLAGVMPNILLILTVTIAFIRGRKAGIVIGFVCGLLIDIFSGNVLGQNAFVYLMFGYVNGWFHTYFYEDDILLPIGLLTANSLAYSFVIFFFFFAMRGRLQFFSYLFKVMIPEAVYTGIVALLIYKILLTGVKTPPAKTLIPASNPHTTIKIANRWFELNFFFCNFIRLSSFIIYRFKYDCIPKIT